MAPWNAFEERPSISIPPTSINDWPESEHSEGYDPERPWRLKRYNPEFDASKFDEDFHIQIRNYNLPRAAIAALAIHEQLERFADRRQTQFRGPPKPDGSNTHQVVYTDPVTGVTLQSNGSADLRLTWVLYTNLLTALHREGQISFSSEGHWIERPLNELRNIMRTQPRFLELLERTRLKDGGRLDQLIPGFEWIHLFGEHLTELACSWQAIFTWCKASGQSNEKGSQLTGDRPRPYLHQALSRLPPVVRLLIILKGRELVFEDALGHEHFEDVLIDKRLWMIDPTSFYDAALESNDFWEGPMAEWDYFLNDRLKPKLARFRKQLQDRFDYRLLVDWGYGRLWKKLYLLQTPATSEEKEAITTVSGFMKAHSKLAWDLYAIHPLVLEDVQADPCSVCLCNYEHEEIVMELSCNHHFHPACLFQYWDDENRFQNRCPECRASQGVLRDRVKFTAGRKDKCYESEPGLQGLDAHVHAAVLESWDADADMSGFPAQLEAFCRCCVVPVLQEIRFQKKQNTPGWGDIK